eukprot:CAMPEP_0183335642 /NCGR_PEP_ID=MMETSP0164_2-20130417/3880_1 /TAXON_ID=221442 /ORGANISM="Coccolithus pelagicus ssp braarudi, Strain PLY182g" /LENGTH=45 /DNA_ID= /DNA_START= /DNA_END= /DNA_ORIENTATION=
MSASMLLPVPMRVCMWPIAVGVSMELQTGLVHVWAGAGTNGQLLS